MALSSVWASTLLTTSKEGIDNLIRVNVKLTKTRIGRKYMA
jgi:hypothetical protein